MPTRFHCLCHELWGHRFEMQRSLEIDLFILRRVSDCLFYSVSEGGDIIRT